MSYKLTITQKPAYLHAIITGVNSRENVARYLEDIQRECTSRGCFRVPIEERLEGPRLGTMEVYEIAAKGSYRALGIFKAVAYVDVNAEGDLMQFAETVAVNRSMPVKVFSSVSDAEKWLLGEDRGGYTRIHSSGRRSEVRKESRGQSEVYLISHLAREHP